MSESSRMVVVLTAVCIASAFLLAVVYKVTKEPIAEQKRLARLAAIKAVLPNYDNEPDKEVKTVTIGKDSKGKEQQIDFYLAKKGEKTVGTAFEVIAKGFGGDINIMMGVIPDGGIKGIKILSHKETPGLGAKITEAWFQKQFNKKTVKDNLQIKKDGGKIDQITGASISSRGVAQGLKAGLKTYQQQFK